MPIPKPQPGEKEQEFVSRCISKIIDEYEQSQAAAICYSKYREKMAKKDKEEMFVLTPRKNENRGMYLKRCASNTKIKMQKNNLKDRMAFCLSSFNEYYKYWNKIEMAEAPKDSAIGMCIAKNKSKGLTYQEAYARCASSVVVQPGPVVMAEDNVNMDVYGYMTEYFQICPGAQATFKELVSQSNSDDVVGMIRSAAVIADKVFEIEDKAIKSESATEMDLNKVKILVEDYKDIIEEIADEQGMEYDISYMDGHIEKVASYVNQQMESDLIVEPVEFSEAAMKCIENHRMAGFPEDKSKEFCKNRMIN